MAAPFRISQQFIWAAPLSSSTCDITTNAAQLQVSVNCYGKAQPFLTSGGKANPIHQIFRSG
jgi:hypothetical protein